MTSPDREVTGRARRSTEFARILDENERYQDVFDRSRLGAAPLGGLAIVACMDARIALEEALGLRIGEAHVIRNAGGLATDDVIRSLVVSQRLLGTDEILVIEHTGCGLHGADGAAVVDRLEAETGARLEMDLGAFDDLEENLRQQLRVLRTHPLLRRVPVHGVIYEVETGRLREVE